MILNSDAVTRDRLKPFQWRAADAIMDMLSSYPTAQNGEFPPFFDQQTGELVPFLCRLRAITGAGKTPMLALCAHALSDAVILWTTNRSSIISQTASNLRAGGKYASLLPEDSTVQLVNEMTPTDWADMTSSEHGLTILLSTVAAFNQESDKLRIHQPRGDTSYWQMLAGEGPDARRRPLYVFYDEGHGASAAQFRRLLELKPQAFVLASASELPAELAYLLPGRTDAERTTAYQKRTIHVPTREVVEAGLLKSRLFLTDCNIEEVEAIREAQEKWLSLFHKMLPTGQIPIACFIVNSTQRGVEVWDALTALGVDKARIAVHLSKAEDLIVERDGATMGLVDTYKAKKTPEQLRSDGYTHLIWNLTLREGWDEPLAYVAYIDDTGKSNIDMVQKIGRFLRQPNARPFDDGDLNAAYFYFNVSDEEFSGLIRATQDEMESAGYEFIALKGGTAPRDSRESPVVRSQTLPGVTVTLGTDVPKLDRILLNAVPLFDDEDKQSRGGVKQRVLDLRRNQEDFSLRRDEERGGNVSITAWDYLSRRLASIDSRVVGKSGHRFSPELRLHKRMQQVLQFGSPAMQAISANIEGVREKLNDEFRFVYKGRHGDYQIKPFNLVAPDLETDDDKKRDKYRVRHFDNSVHAEYNGMNEFEIKVANALDALGLAWCRNPSRTGYGIPIPELGAGTTDFYPDFLLWTDNEIWAIDPKGAHLAQEATHKKLLGLSGIVGMPQPMRVALVLEGHYALGAGESVNKRGTDGVTLIRRTTTGPKATPFAALSELMFALRESQ